MLYALIILVAGIALVLLLNLRIRIDLDRDRRLVFLGLGRSGPEIDFATRTGAVRLFGVRVKSFELGRAKKKAAVPAVPTEEKKAVKKPKRERPLKDVLAVAPRCVCAAVGYLIDLWKSIVVEELEGRVEAGFDSPDLTGQVYGYYQAALAAVPGVAGRFAWVPDWTGPSLSGSMRLTVALPLHRLALRTLVLMCKLPLRELIKLAIGKKKGVQDGQ
ncbi:MAG: hypothetical protein OEW00_07280 [candidate division Zixibacteria bacterium]|nr:hypothetical protein [candidate division Zixibacteria bacterium]